MIIVSKSFVPMTVGNTRPWTYFARRLVSHVKSVSVIIRSAMAKQKGCIAPS